VRGANKVFAVDRFIEKPNLVTATRFMNDWQYLLNPAWFIFRADAMLDKFKRWLNPSYKLLMQFEKTIGTSREQQTLKRLWPKMQKISIDYGIMEKDRSMLVIPANISWTDIGSWRAVYDMIATDKTTNVFRGQHIVHDASGNLIYSYSGKLVAAVGIHDMIIVETADAILVCPKDRAQDVKHLVAEIERKKLHRYL
jgi:mannose-1-phosphate guanylyltransferase